MEEKEKLENQQSVLWFFVLFIYVFLWISSYQVYEKNLAVYRNTEIKEELQKKINISQLLLDNIDTGIIILNAQWIIMEEGSSVNAFVYLDQEPSDVIGKPLVEVLRSRLNEEDANLFEKFVNIARKNGLKSIIERNPLSKISFEKDRNKNLQHHVSFDFRAIKQKGRDVIIVFIKDRTSEVEIEKKLEESKNQHTKIFESFLKSLKRSPEMMRNYFHRVENILNELNALLETSKKPHEEERYGYCRDSIHALKAHADQYNTLLKEKLHGLEDAMEAVKKGKYSPPLLIIKMKDILDLVRTLEKITAIIIDNENQKNNGLEHLLLSYDAQIKNVAQREKKLIEIEWDGDIGIKNQKKAFAEETKIMEAFQYIWEECLGLLVINAITHGIETPENRIAKGKTDIGKIKVTFFYKEGKINMQIEDDGKGIMIEKLKEKAKEKGFSDKSNNIMDYLTLPGLTTKENVTEDAGRGLGMSHVQRFIKKHDGTIAVRTEPDKGTVFIIELKTPVTI
jgi:signal transduction histidine kinase